MEHIAVYPSGALHLSPAASTSMHAQHATKWVLPVDGARLVLTHANTTTQLPMGSALRVGAHVRHALACEGPVLALFDFEPERRAPVERPLRVLSARDVERVGLRDAVRSAIDAPNEADVIGPFARTALLAFEGRPRRRPLDRRVARVLTQLSARPDDTHPLARLAETVSLSPHHLAHLFKDAVGWPIRRYLKWQRLLVAVDAIGRGARFTDAALGAGFSDHAHFSRTFREMLGRAPSELSAPLSR